MNISNQDFKYLRSKIHADEEYHQKQFLQRIDPDLIDSYFEGDPQNAWEKNDNTIYRMTTQRIFPATSTLLAQLYPSNPKFTCTGRGAANELDANVAAASMNYYMEQMGAKTENQRAIMSGWLYGFGTTKQGWRTVFKKNEPSDVDTTKSEEQGMMKKVMNWIAPKGKPSMEEETTPEYVAEEAPFLRYVNNKNIFFDKDQPFGLSRFITEKLPRTLYDIRNSGIYSLPDDFYNKFKRGKDEREISLDLYEQWIWDDGLWVMVMVEGWDKPLRYDKMPYAEGFPYKTIVFIEQVNRLYRISHMKVAQRQQRLLDYILTLQKEAIEKYKDITIFNGQAFDTDDKASIKANRIGTNLYTKNGVPAGAAAQHIGGNSIPQDMFVISDKLDANVREILSVVGARASGNSEYDTATQEKIADFGNQIRSLGLQDSVKDFLKAQGKKLLQDIKQFDTAPHLLKVTGLNIQDPETGELVTEKWVEFGTRNSPKTLKEVIPADLDIDVDVTEWARRDIAVVRKQLNEFVTQVVMPMKDILLAQGKVFNAVEFIKDAAKNYETLSNPEKYFIDAPQPQVAPIAPPMPGSAPTGDTSGAPSAEKIAIAANAVKTGMPIEGMMA